MNANDRDMMQRYLYEVSRRLPKEQREEISLELQGLIEEMFEGDPDMERVLAKLGDPAQFAKRYRDDSRCLIGPEYYDDYLWMLKIVLICAAIPVFITAVVSGILEGSGVISAIVESVVGAIVNLTVCCLGVFGGVTLVFAVMERQKIKLDLRQPQKWTPGSLKGRIVPEKRTWAPSFLPPVPDKRALISRGDSIVSIVFIALFGALLVFAPGLIGAYYKEGELLRQIPVFNLSQWALLLPVLLLWLLVGFVDEVMRLVMGCYCKAVMICNILSGALQVLLAAVLLKVLPLWNLNFGAELSRRFPSLFEETNPFLAQWGTGMFSNLLLLLICAATLLEIGVTVYKTLRYGAKSY